MLNAYTSMTLTVTAKRSPMLANVNSALHASTENHEWI